jgi:hypothetical protein
MSNRNDAVGQQIAALKKSSVFKTLGPGPQQLAVHLMRKYANGTGDMFPRQGAGWRDDASRKTRKDDLNVKFGVSRRT